MISRSTSLLGIATVVSEACRRNGIEVVLSGGACVSIYTRNAYESYDLDFVLSADADRRRVGPVLEKLGFCRDGRHFRHPDTAYIVEFLSPPLSVGDEPVGRVGQLRSGKRVLKLLSPTDCVKDRLAAFYHWSDRPSLEQAILVCRDCEVDLREVRRWSLHEEMEGKYEVFKRELRKSRKRELPGIIQSGRLYRV